MDEADPVTEALGEPVRTSELASCAHQGMDIYWFYNDFELMTNEIDGVNYITGITLKDDLVSTRQGVRIGMDISEATALLGDGYENSGSVYRYVSGSTLLSLNTDTDGTVSDIQFTEYSK